MTWLFPLYLLGAGAVIAPILMHLRRRPPQDQVDFSSLMFLEAQTPLPVSRRRLENWLLLLLRCLLLILLALMFARPVWRPEEAPTASSGTATLLLLDDSASMRRGNLWKLGRDEALRRASGLATADRVSVALFAQDMRQLWSFEEDRTSASARTAALKQRLEKQQPGWSSTDLGAALVEACQVFSRTPGLRGMTRRIVLISDLQEGSATEALRSQVWPETLSVEIHRVEAANPDNLTLSLAAETSEIPAQADARTRVRISNNRNSRITDFRLDTQPPVSGHLPPGASRVISVPRAGSSITLLGDAWDFDNTIHVAPAQPKPVKVAFIGDASTRNEASSPLFYLSRALQPTAALQPELIILPEATAAIPADIQMIFIAGRPPRASLRDYLASGGFVVAVITDQTTAADLEALTGTAAAGWKVGAERPGKAEDYAMLAEVDTAHPLLRPFADERLRDFSKLRFWHHRRVTPPGGGSYTIPARFDDGDPAMIAGSTAGRGTLLLLTSGWHPSDSQLALSTKFVPLLYGWLEAAGFRNERPATWLVGDMLPNQHWNSVTQPGGVSQPLRPGEGFRAPMPGLFTFSGNGRKPEQLAVNLAPEEGRVTPLDLARLRELGVRIETAAGPAQARAAAREQLALNEEEGRQRAWSWLLALVLGLLALETWLAARSRASLPAQPRPA